MSANAPPAALLTPHDYENLALINIKRCLATEGTAGVTHWRTYSDMANSRHDDSTAYDKNTNRKRSGNNSSSRRKTAKEEPNSSKGKNAADYSNCYGSLKYYDIYPLSREMKEQLYKNITPGKGASKSGKEEHEDEETNNVTTSTSDTYEPIEAYCCKMEEDKTSSLPLTLLLVVHLDCLLKPHGVALQRARFFEDMSMLGHFMYAVLADVVLRSYHPSDTCAAARRLRLS